LILNENHREEITPFQNKSITEFIAIKHKLQDLILELETSTVALATDALLLLETKGLI